MFGIIKLTIHTITGMWVSIVLFKLMTNGWSGFYFQCCVLSLVFLTVSWLLSGEWLAGKSKAEPSCSTLLSFTRYAFLKRAKRCSTTTKKTGTAINFMASPVLFPAAASPKISIDGMPL